MSEANEEFLMNLSQLGFPMLEPRQELNVNKILADVITSKDIRIWEGFPIVLLNALENKKFSVESIKQYLDSKIQEEQLESLILISGAVFSHFHISDLWWNKYKKSLPNRDLIQIRKWKNEFAKNNNIVWRDLELDSERVKRLFGLYYENRAEKSSREEKKYEEFSLEHSLSQIFSPKQKELFKKKLAGAPLNKTEKEYYSRTVKKKIIALANEQLHDLSRRILKL